jgi:tetratricopeptide (TPR) repeat protein
VLETVFDAWVREAEQKLLLAAEHPLIDDAQIDMAEELRTCANQVVEEYFGEESTSIPSKIEPTIEFFEVRLIGSESALPVRFVILNFLYRLAHFTGFISESSAPELHRAVWPHLERFVRLQEVGVLNDPRAIRWEITNACVIRDWDRTSVLFDLLKSLGPITVSEHRALKGQMYVCSVVAPRNEDEDEEEPALRDFLGWWVLKLDRAYFSGDDFGSSIRPTGLLAWGMTLADDTEYSAGEYERLSDAAHEWEICFEKTSDLLGSYRAAWGKCHFLRKDYLSAAKQFDWLLACGCGLPHEMEVLVRAKLYLNAAECYSKGGDTEAAIRRLEECAQEFPRTRGLWLKLAGLYLSSPLDLDLQKVQECLRKEEEIDPAFGEDPLASIALALGELAGTGLRAALRKVAESNPGDLHFMSSVVSRHWPAFQSLDEQSRKEWVGAALFLWGPSPLRSVLRRKVAGAFADIAEGQLRRLFDRFRQERGPAVLQAMSPALRKDKFLKYLEKRSHLGLGDMIFEIEATRRLPEPVYPDLKSWLQRHARRLAQNWDPSRARRLNELRRSSSHPGGEISEQEALELYDLSAWLVSQLAAN